MTLFFQWLMFHKLPEVGCGLLLFFFFFFFASVQDIIGSMRTISVNNYTLKEVIFQSIAAYKYAELSMLTPSKQLFLLSFRRNSL